MYKASIDTTLIQRIGQHLLSGGSLYHRNPAIAQVGNGIDVAAVQHHEARSGRIEEVGKIDSFLP